MSGDQRLGWGYGLNGIVAIAGAIYYWNTIHPFGQEPPSVQSGAHTIEAVDALNSSSDSSPSTAATATDTPSAVVEPVATSTSSSLVSVNTPEPTSPAPAIEATAAINYMELVQNKANWPKIIRLKIETVFPVVVGDKQIGNVTAPAGSEVDLLKVAGEKSLLVQFNTAQTIVDADVTNFEELVYEKLRAGSKK